MSLLLFDKNDSAGLNRMHLGPQSDSHAKADKGGQQMGGQIKLPRATKTNVVIGQQPTQAALEIHCLFTHFLQVAVVFTAVFFWNIR